MVTSGGGWSRWRSGTSKGGGHVGRRLVAWVPVTATHPMRVYADSGRGGQVGPHRESSDDVDPDGPKQRTGSRAPPDPSETASDWRPPPSGSDFAESHAVPSHADNVSTPNRQSIPTPPAFLCQSTGRDQGPVPLVQRIPSTCRPTSTLPHAPCLCCPLSAPSHTRRRRATHHCPSAGPFTATRSAS